MQGIEESSLQVPAEIDDVKIVQKIVKKMLFRILFGAFKTWANSVEDLRHRKLNEEIISLLERTSLYSRIKSQIFLL